MKCVMKTSMALALCAVVGACSGDDAEGGSSTQGGSGASGSTDAVGMTGTTTGTLGSATGDNAADNDATGANATAGSATSTAMASVECGSATCTVAGLAAMFGGQACCVDASAGTCGTAMAGGECMPPAEPGVPDERCTPDIDSSPLPLSGCCIDEMCGVDLSLLQQGCIEYSQLGSLTSMFGAGGGFALPEPRRCDEPPPEMMDADAGI